MSKNCNWAWVDKLPDVYVPAVEGPDVFEGAKEDGYVDISLWVCITCGEIKAEVD